MRGINVILILIFITIIFSCSKSPNELIIGKWIAIDSNIGYEFTDNNKMIFTQPDKNKLYGNYSFIGSSRIKCIIMDGSMSFIITTKFNNDGNILELFNESDKYTNKFLRIDNLGYNQIFNFSNGIARVSKNNKYGFINSDGTEIIKPLYDNANNYSDGRCLVELNQRLLIINKKGEIKKELSKDKIIPQENFNDNSIMTQLYGQYDKGFSVWNTESFKNIFDFKPYLYEEAYSLIVNKQKKYFGGAERLIIVTASMPLDRSISERDQIAMKHIFNTHKTYYSKTEYCVFGVFVYINCFGNWVLEEKDYSFYVSLDRYDKIFNEIKIFIVGSDKIGVFIKGKKNWGRDSGRDENSTFVFFKGKMVQVDSGYPEIEHNGKGGFFYRIIDFNSGKILNAEDKEYYYVINSNSSDNTLNTEEKEVYFKTNSKSIDTLAFVEGVYIPKRFEMEGLNSWQKYKNDLLKSYMDSVALENSKKVR